MRRVGLILALLSSTAFVPGAHAAAPLPSRPALLKALTEIHQFAQQAGTGPSRSAAARAAKVLTSATTPERWVSPRELVAPPYGKGVFTDAAAALSDLQGLARSNSLRAPVALIVGAARGVAAHVISDARGGDAAAITAARRALAEGARMAASGHAAAAVRAYAVAWAQAFGALTQVVAATVTSVPPASVAAAAEAALGSRKIGLAGPMILRKPQPLTLAGKPELFFGGAEGCPFCGVQRWGMIVALSQFGTFSNLHLMQSETTETPVVRTFTFLGSSYQSPYVSFVPVEILSNVRRGENFLHLQHLTSSQRSLLTRFDPQGQTPFIDVAGRFIQVDSTVQPQLIGGMSWTKIASTLADPTSVPAQTIAGEAEVLTAELCLATGGNPASVCSSTVVRDYEAALPRLNGRGGGCPTTATDTAGRRQRQPPVAQTTRCHH